MFARIPAFVDGLSARAAKRTEGFAQSKFGQLFQSLVLIGPITFVPTVYQAWFAPNIDALRTPTWAGMLIVNIAGLITLVHKGDWRMRLVSVLYTGLISAVYIGTLVR